MKPSSEKRLQQLHPALASAVRAVVADLAARGIVVEVVQGLRTYQEQDELYAKGRTKPGPIVTQARGGQSNHNFGLAVDLCPFTNDKPDWNAPMSVWAAIGAAAEARGLEWGGSWKKFLDKPHVQLPVMTIKECASCYQAGGLDAVWSTASTKIGWVDASRETPTRARARRRVATKRRGKRVVKTRAKKTTNKTGKAAKAAAKSTRRTRARRRGARS
jgi:peptidoglycan L-alanyl-D-glutamate endopeptidase CwlK